MIRNMPDEVKQQQAERDGDSQSSNSGAVKKKRITANSFATILADVIESPGFEDAIYWSEDGKSFRVIPKTFTEKVLEQHMKGTKFSSFFRRLIRWGFERVVLDEFPMDAFVFRHEMFQRGQASLLRTLSPYHVSRGKRVSSSSVQQSIVKAKKTSLSSSSSRKASPRGENKKVPPSKAADSAARTVVPFSQSNINPLLRTQPSRLLQSGSIAFPRQCTNEQEATMALIRRQQELALLSQTMSNTTTSSSTANSRVGLEQNLHALLTQRLAADRNASTMDMGLLARELQIRDLVRNANPWTTPRLPQERTTAPWLFSSNNNNNEGMVSDPERLALLSMLLRQENAHPRMSAAAILETTTTRYEELFRLVNLMNRLQE